MRPINLLPPEALQKARARRKRWLGIGAALIFIGLLAAATVWFQGRVNDKNAELEREQAIVTQLQAEVAGLSEFAALKAEFDTNVLILATALDKDVVWGRLLNDLGRMLPDRVWLSSFSGTVNVDPTSPIIGEVAVTGVGFEFPDVSAWLRSLDASTFPSVDQTWVSTISVGLVGEVPVVDFASSTFLTDAALSDRLSLRIPVTP